MGVRALEHAVMIFRTVFPVGRRGMIFFFFTNFVEPGFQIYLGKIYSCVAIFRTRILSKIVYLKKCFNLREIIFIVT